MRRAVGGGGGQRLGEEPVERLALAITAGPERLAAVQIADDGQEFVPAAPLCQYG